MLALESRGVVMPGRVFVSIVVCPVNQCRYLPSSIVLSDLSKEMGRNWQKLKQDAVRYGGKCSGGGGDWQWDLKRRYVRWWREGVL
jgi:hypothetical protein